MDILSAILWIISIGVIVYIALLVFFLYMLFKLTKKYPIPALFVLIILIGVGIAETLSVAGITAGIATVTGSVITIILSYKRLSKAVKDKLK